MLRGRAFAQTSSDGPSTSGTSKRKGQEPSTNSLEGTVGNLGHIMEQTKRLRISRSPGELVMRKELQHYVCPRGITVEGGEMSNEIIVRLSSPEHIYSYGNAKTESQRSIPCNFLVVFGPHYPHNAPSVICLDVPNATGATPVVRNIRNIGTLFAEGVGCGDSSDPPQHVSAGQGQGQEASEPVSVPSFLVERCASLLQVLY